MLDNVIETSAATTSTVLKDEILPLQKPFRKSENMLAFLRYSNVYINDMPVKRHERCQQKPATAQILEP